VSRRRKRGKRWLDVVLFVIVAALGIALYHTAGLGPVVLACVVTALFVAFANSRPRRRRRH
jgi:uncharacterized membrane protein HdeD (DUF308 family)